MPVHAYCKFEHTGTVTLYVVIDAIMGRHEEELHTAILANRAVIFSVLGADTAFCHFVMKQDGCTCMCYPEKHRGLIGVVIPIHTPYGLETNAVTV
jgi:hypothetical protein